MSPSETLARRRSTYPSNGGHAASEPPGRPKASETPSGGRSTYPSNGGQA
jgi:hypothetical protein